ncbi:hypothetical protein ACROYT_G025507 [Oculina patagonica]
MFERSRAQEAGQPRKETRQLKVSDLKSAECEIIRTTQKKAFKEEIAILQKMKQESPDPDSRDFAQQRKVNMKTCSSLYKLDPFIDEDGILAIHLEIANSLETDSIINALRRFINRRGPIRQLRSDRGTNFVGARNELTQALAEMDQEKIKTELLKEQCDWFSFKMNIPAASHMGGVWERQIRSVRNVLSSLLQDNGKQLDNESLSTLMSEAEAIVNSRPLTVNQLADPDSSSPLTPNHLLTMKSKVVLPPPGSFQPADMYCRKRWRRVQHLANEFWTRWRKEFLLSLQQRQKWTRPRRNLLVNDVVLIKDENLPRNAWQLARVSAVYPSSDGQVRKVQIALADSCLDNKGKRIDSVRYLERPVQKLVLLMPASKN